MVSITVANTNDYLLFKLNHAWMLYLLAIGFVLSCEYVAEMPCSQLLLIESAMYVYAQDQFTSYQKHSNEPPQYSLGCPV